MSKITPRELQITRLMALGLSNYAIGQDLGISEHTVSNHVTSILRKLDVKNRTHAAVMAVVRGIITVNTVILMVALGTHPMDIDMKRDSRRYKRRRMAHNAVLTNEVVNIYHIPDRIG